MRRRSRKRRSRKRVTKRSSRKRVTRRSRKRRSRKRRSRKRRSRKRRSRKRVLIPIKYNKFTIDQKKYPVCWMASVMLLIKNIGLEMNKEIAKFLNNIFNMFLDGTLGISCPMMPKKLSQIYKAYWPAEMCKKKTINEWLLGELTISDQLVFAQAVIHAGGYKKPEIYYISNAAVVYNWSGNWEKTLQKNVKASRQIDIFLVGKDYGLGKYLQSKSQLDLYGQPMTWTWPPPTVRELDYNSKPLDTAEFIKFINNCSAKIKGGLLFLSFPYKTGPCGHLIAFFKHEKENYFCNTWGQPCAGITKANLAREFGKNVVIQLAVLLSVPDYYLS